MARKEGQERERKEREKLRSAGESGGFVQETQENRGEGGTQSGKGEHGSGGGGSFGRGSGEEREQQKTPREARQGRTIGDTATSYTSVGGLEVPEEWAQRVPEPDDNAPDYETPGGYQPDEPEAATGPVHDIAFRPAPGGMIETPGHRGKNIPYTGEVVSTRDSNFEEDPDTGRTASEEEGEYVTESLERRTRGYESG
jgi:hypothetical protein